MIQFPELGVKLFHRGKYNVTLTEDGMLLKRRSQELVELSDKTIQEFSHKEDTLAGEIALCFDLGAIYEDLCFIPLSPELETGAVLVWKKSQMLAAATSQFIHQIKNTI